MTNNNMLYIVIAIVALAIIGGGIYWYMQSQTSYTANPYSTTPTNSGTQNNPGTPSGY